MPIKQHFYSVLCKNFNRPTSVFWVVGNASANSVLITDYLASNQHGGDRLRRVFPLSPFDYSIEVSVNRDVHLRSYSCVIDGATGAETSLFTYTVRTINLERLSEQPAVTRKNVTTTTLAPGETTTTVPTTPAQTLLAHDVLNPTDVDALRRRGHQEKTNSNEDVSGEDHLLNLEQHDKSVQKAIDADVDHRK